LLREVAEIRGGVEDEVDRGGRALEQRGSKG